jgi:hypothetical protein
VNEALTVHNFFPTLATLFSQTSRLCVLPTVSRSISGTETKILTAAGQSTKFSFSIMRFQRTSTSQSTSPLVTVGVRGAVEFVVHHLMIEQRFVLLHVDYTYVME